jgi:small neutral amino acid transporter SnatA (MarC family)
VNLWLATVLLLAATNPPRRRAELPVSTAVVAAGAGFTLVALVGLGAAGDSILETLDISAPTFRVAVGLVLLVRGVIDLFVAPAAAGEGLTGWRAAIVPVFFPVLFRPEIALVAVSVAVDGSVWRLMVGATLAMLLVVGAVAWLRRFDRAVGRGVSVVLMVLAVDRLIDGVFAL